MSTKDILALFVGHDGRRWVKQPFNLGGFTFATCGHALVRFPAIDMPGPADDAPKSLGDTLATIFRDVETGTFAPPPKAIFPPPVADVKNPCERCVGNGTAYGEKCDECDGAGFILKEMQQSATVHDVTINAKWLRIVFSLPGVKIATAHNDRLLFTFDGGDGAIMGCRTRLDVDLGDVNALVSRVPA